MFIHEAERLYTGHHSHTLFMSMCKLATETRLSRLSQADAKNVKPKTAIITHDDPYWILDTALANYAIISIAVSIPISVVIPDTIMWKHALYAFSNHRFK